MRVVGSEKMRMLDEATINRFEPGVVLMERAGQGLFETVMELAPDPSGECVSIFLGRGNNAGDGLVLARLLAEAGAKVVLHYMHEPDKFSPDAFKNYAKTRKLVKSRKIVEIFLYLADWKEKSAEALDESTVIVDALLGTGINSPVREEYAAVIGMINSMPLPVVAVDIPSGINGSTGEVMGSAVEADVTVTMGLPKIGLVFYPGKAYCGSIKVVDIGIPEEVMAENGIDDHVLDFATALGDLPAMSPDAHKFGRGGLLVAAGSRRYSGAAYLAAASALRTGCGIVYLAAPASIRAVIQSMAPEIIFIELPETGGGSISGISPGDLPDPGHYRAVAVGPGLTVDPSTVDFVGRFIEATAPKPIVLDADGINAFRGAFGRLKESTSGRDLVITPHGGELAGLAGIGGIPQSPLEKMELMRALVKGSNATLVCKGAPTMIAHPDGRLDINVFGHPGMATAGSGDVLTGAIAGIMAQGAGAAAASRLGVYLHSRAAEIAAEGVGERGMTAGDCCGAVSSAVRELEEAGNGDV